jgi:ABC-type uncharacterized transport system involved in gliding motility auxiliary subunit
MTSNRTSLTLIGLAALAVLLVATNILATALLPGWRLDLTQDRLYTLSSGTKQVLGDLPEPVTLRLYLSQRLLRDVPGYGPYAQRVNDLLAEYAQLSRGRLTVETFDPEPFTDVEDRAVAAGLTGAPVIQQGDQVYFGLVGTNTTDDVETIPFFQTDRERFLEYDLTRLVNRLAHPKQHVVGLISSLPLMGDPMQAMMGGAPSQPWLVIDQIRQFFEIRSLPADTTEIPKDVDLLMIVHPATMSDQTQYAIDQFVLAGGKALIFVDPFAESAASQMMQAMQRGMPSPSPVSDLPKLFKAWGVKMEPNVVAGDRRNAKRVSLGGSSKLRAVDYPAWIGVPADDLNQDDAITAQLQVINLATSGILTATADATTKFEPLISTSAQSEPIPVDKVMGNPPDIMSLLREFKPTGQSLTLAARITGPVKSAFPDGPPKPEAKTPDGKPADAKPAAPAAAGLTESKTPIDVIVVADTDLLQDRFWAQQSDFFGERVTQESANNAGFVVNSLDALTGSSGLIGLRSRGISDRPFTLIKDLQDDADSRFAEQEQALNDKLKATERQLTELRHGQAGARCSIRCAPISTGSKIRSASPISPPFRGWSRSPPWC